MPAQALMCTLSVRLQHYKFCHDWRDTLWWQQEHQLRDAIMRHFCMLCMPEAYVHCSCQQSGQMY